MDTFQITPHSIKEFIHSKELERRSLFSVEAEQVLRYGGFVGNDVHLFKSLPRAMKYSRSLIDRTVASGKSFNNGTIVIAGELTGSKGRFTRSWHAPEGGLWGCLVHVGSLLDSARSFIPMATGIACCEAVREFGCDSATIRWVNDVLVDDKKLAGFLVESFFDKTHNERYELIGFGINVNNNQFPEELSSIATSLSAVLGKQIDLSAFAHSFFAKLSWNLGLLYHHEEQLLGLSCDCVDPEHPIITGWKSMSDTIGKDVVYGFDVMEKPQYKARVLKIRNDGGLEMVLEDGSTLVEHSGEVRYL